MGSKLQMVAQADEAEVMVKLENAYKVYQMGEQQVNALAGITVSFSRGSFWAIMGPSGSGKSTMMNVLGCLDRLTAGRYFLEGSDVSALNDDSLSELRLRHLGFVFQSFNLIPQLTVQRNIEFTADNAENAERTKALLSGRRVLRGKNTVSSVASLA